MSPSPGGLRLGRGGGEGGRRGAGGQLGHPRDRGGCGAGLGGDYDEDDDSTTTLLRSGVRGHGGGSQEPPRHPVPAPAAGLLRPPLPLVHGDRDELRRAQGDDGHQADLRHGAGPGLLGTTKPLRYFSSLILIVLKNYKTPAPGWLLDGRVRDGR